MKIHINRLVPGRAEILFCLFLAALLGALSNTKLLISTLGLDSAVLSISDGAAQTLTSSLSKLDSYEITTTIVTFGVWAMIGLFTLSIIQGFGHVIYDLDETNKMSTNAYVHPSNFTKKGFWRDVALTGLGTFAVAVITIGYILMFCLYLLPLSAMYIGAYVSNFEIKELPYALLGLVLLFVSIIGLNVCARLIRFRHQLITN